MITDNEIYDSLKNDPFVVDELFEDVFNALKGVYFRLYYKESRRDEVTINKGRAEAFLAKSDKFDQLKWSFKYNDWAGKWDAVKQYSPELREMLALELSEYATLK